MAESPMVGVRVKEEWAEQIKAIALAAGRKEAEIVRDAIAQARTQGFAQYLGKTDPAAVKGAISDLQERVASLERKLAGLGRLVG